MVFLSRNFHDLILVVLVEIPHDAHIFGKIVILAITQKTTTNTPLLQDLQLVFLPRTIEIFSTSELFISTTETNLPRFGEVENYEQRAKEILGRFPKTI